MSARPNRIPRGGAPVTATRKLTFRIVAVTFGFVPSSWSQVEIQKIVNTDVARRFYRTAPAGDVNGDGVPDVSVSGFGYGAIFSGSDGSELHGFLSSTTVPSSLVIGTVDRVGDLDGDDGDDIAFGAPDEAPGGHVRVFSGKTGALIHDLVGDAPPGVGLNFLGYEVAGLGDVNGDGAPDFGASRSSFLADEPPAVFVYSGLTGAAIFSNFDQSGASAPNIARAGDVDGDGLADVLVAYIRSPYFESCASVVELRSGAGGALLRSFEDPAMCGDGTGMVGGVDLDGDAVPDVIVGSIYGVWKGPYVTGMLKAYSGANGNLLFVREGRGAECSVGASMTIVGDANADGFVDLAVGEPDLPTAAGVESGAVHVFSAGAGPRFDFSLLGDAKDVRFGTSLCAPGDLNDDGFDDLSVTAPGAGPTIGPQGSLVTYSLAGAAEDQDRFVPGSTLRGAIGNGDTDDAAFDALMGMKLELTFEVVSGDLAPRVRVESKDGKHSVTWSPKKTGLAKKTISLKRDGEYVLRVYGKHGTTGSYRVGTKWKSLGSTPQSLLTTKKGKNGKPPQVKFRAVRGTIVVGSVEALVGPEAPPALELEDPAGATISLASFLDFSEFEANESWLDGVSIAESGEHVLSVVAGSSAPSEARFVFDMITPRGRELLDIE